MDASAQVRAWFDAHTHARSTATVDEIRARLDGRRVSVILPARDEAATIGAVVSGVLSLGDLVHEVLVIDSRSTDDTAAIAASHGARVVSVDETPDPGKGGAMRLGVARMTGELGAFVDADIVDFDPRFVVGLLDALTVDPRRVLVKGFYDRPWSPADAPDESRPVGGGRVTELVARPLVARRAPLLAGFAQPLAGEVAFVRSALLDLPFVSGYGVDVALLLGVLERFGLDAMAQVDLGVRVHGHQELDALGAMALQVAAAFDICLDGADRVERTRTTVDRGPDGLVLDEVPVAAWRLDPPASL